MKTLDDVLEFLRSQDLSVPEQAFVVRAAESSPPPGMAQVISTAIICQCGAWSVGGSSSYTHEDSAEAMATEFLPCDCPAEKVPQRHVELNIGLCIPTHGKRESATPSPI